MIPNSSPRLEFTRLRTAIGGVLALAGVATGAPASAGVVRVEIASVAPASAVPGARPYEIVVGRFHGELDPRDPHNRLIVDLTGAPRNARGRVEYSATFKLARPVDPADASGLLFYDVPNRGNGDVAADPDGHVRVISGWQGDLPEDARLQTARVPLAHGARGRSLTGPVLARFQDMPPGTRSLPITGSIGLPTARPAPVSLDTRRASLSWQGAPADSLHPIAPQDWSFGDCTSAPFPGTPDGHRVCLRAGFDPARAYTLVYEGKDPLVLGIGFAATRDLVAFLRHEAADASGTANPARAIRWVVASGTSQSGNYLRSFVHLGFNADEQGRAVFDGINPNIAARQVPLNLRFGVPGGAARVFEPGSEGTLWWAPYDDRARGRGRSSLLDRCTASRTCPKVLETFGSAEFWGLRMSPGLVGTDAKGDLPLPANVRRYYFPSVTHGGSWTGGFKAAGDGPVPNCRLPGNPNPSRESMRVVHRMLVAWVRDGAEPAPSRVPTIAAGDLVEPTARAMGWPSLPGAPTPDGKLNALPDHDFGRGLRANDVSGVLTRLPPTVRGTIPMRVPRVDADGNETAGIPSVQLQVPLGTYLGWNETTTGFEAGGGCSFIGGFLPFARTKAERTAIGDPRLSLEERYGDHEGFVAKVREAVQRQLAAGWLLPDDAERLIDAARTSRVLEAARDP